MTRPYCLPTFAFVFATLMAVCTAKLGHAAPTAVPQPHAAAIEAPFLHQATFVHMVGRMWMIEQWVTHDLLGTLIEAMPITHEGNPAFRVTYLPQDSTEPKTVILMANGAFEKGEFQPIEVDPPTS